MNTLMESLIAPEFPTNKEYKLPLFGDCLPSNPNAKKGKKGKGGKGGKKGKK